MKLIIFIFTLILHNSSLAQESVVKWSGAFNEQSKELKITANLKPGWHLYSQHVDPMAGPIPTQFEFQENERYQLVAKVVEPEAIKAYDKNFESEVLYFEKKVEFVQKLKVLQPTIVFCSVNFMVCNDEMCLPPIDELIEVKVN